MIKKLEKADGQSMDIVESNIEQLKDLFPEVFAEGKINFDRLQEVLGNYVVSDEDHYNFTWHGKRAAGRLAQTPSTGTLRPCPQESVDWDKTQNLFIEGDNLEVLKLLQKSYHRQIKMIYIDPPYNTGNDFVYEDDFKDGVKNYLAVTGQLDDEGKKRGTNSSSAGRYHTNWLNMMYPRLKLARNLLRDDGVIFISIDDNEQDNLKKLCNEVFGEENFVELLIWRKKSGGGQQDDYIVTEHDYILCYAKRKDMFKLVNKTTQAKTSGFNCFDDAKQKKYKKVKLAKWGSAALREDRPTMYDYPELKNPDGEQSFPIAPDGRPGRWRYGRQRVIEMLKNDDIAWDQVDGEWMAYEKDYEPSEDDLMVLKERSIFYDLVENGEGADELTGLFGVKDVFQNPKPKDLIAHLSYLSTPNNQSDIVLDFFAGSGSTGHGVMELNKLDSGKRRYILVQLPEQISADKKEQKSAYDFCQQNKLPLRISEITKERLRRAIGKVREDAPLFSGDLGFKVFKLDTSNIKTWEAGFDTLKDDLIAAADYIKQDRSSDDIVFELLLKYGLDLTVPIETRTIAGKKVYSIGLGALVVCLDSDVPMETVNGIGALKEELKPEIMRVVFKDSGFKDDVVKTNALQTLKRFGIEDIKSL